MDSKQCYVPGKADHRMGMGMETEYISPFKYFTLAPLGENLSEHAGDVIERLERTTTAESITKLENVGQLATGTAGGATPGIELVEKGKAASEEENGEATARLAWNYSTPRVIRTAVDSTVEVDSFVALDDGKTENLEYLALVSSEETVKKEFKTPGEPTRTRSERVYVGEALNKEASMPPPWAADLGTGHWMRSPLLQLHKEIVDFCEFVSPTEEEHAERCAAVERISSAVKCVWPNCQVCVFGSFATGLYLPTSDIDMVILNSGCLVLKDGLRALAKTLTRQSLIKRLQVIAHARVPIIKFVEKKSNISFDISFDVANGPQAAEFIKGATELLPPLKPLCLVLKIFLQQRELNEVYSGGIGSYALLVMLLTHLQMHPSRWKKRQDSFGALAEDNLGMLLVDFFELYGRSLNMKEVGVSCRDGGRFYSKKRRGFSDSRRPHLLSVEDPQTPENDIGKNSFSIQKVQTAFALAHRLLTQFHADEAPVDVGLLGRIVRMDRTLIERKAPVPNYGQTPGGQVVSYVGQDSPADHVRDYHNRQSPVARYSPGTGQFLSDGDSDDFKEQRGLKRSRWQDEDARGGKSERLSSKSARKRKRRAVVEQALGRKISKREWKDLMADGSTPEKNARDGKEKGAKGAQVKYNEPSSSSRKQTKRSRGFDDGDGDRGDQQSSRKAASLSPTHSVDAQGLSKRSNHKQGQGHDETSPVRKSWHESRYEPRIRRHPKYGGSDAGTSKTETGYASSESQLSGETGG